MNQLQIFIIRAVLGGVFAVILTKIFRPDAGAPAMIGLAIILVGLAYVFEFFRKKKS
ncbi:MAG TPA: hypothetical protein VKN73_13515 [Desulfosalsimonadaceae bacterium]|nr:hypothetical protein [Desulfosalsimonadaceae bacterium]